jgi:hypothetical protein
MKGRILRLGLVLAWAFPGLLGCEHHRSFFRPEEGSHDRQQASQGVDAVESDTSKIEAVDSDGRSPKSFFQNNRRTGGLSSEAREIEGHFGIQ